MIAVGRLVQELSDETRAGWSWMLTLSQVESPGWLAYHGPRGARCAANDPGASILGSPRIELWPTGGAGQPVLTVSVAANQRFRDDLRRVYERPTEPKAGWLLLLGLIHALDEVSRAKPRIATVGDGVTATGVTTLGGWASALTLADLQSALLRTQD